MILWNKKIAFICKKKSSIVHNKVWLKLIYYPESEFYTYRTRAIITHGLYTFYPLFEVYVLWPLALCMVSIQE